MNVTRVLRGVVRTVGTWACHRPNIELDGRLKECSFRSLSLTRL